MRIGVAALCLLAAAVGACGDPVPVSAPLSPITAPPAASPRLSPARSSVARPKHTPVSPAALPLTLPDARTPPNTEVYVVDEAGDPIGEASILASRDRARTDDEGRAHIYIGVARGTPSQMTEDKTIAVSAPGRVAVRHLCSPGSGRVEVVRLAERGLEVHGRCVDSAGLPAAGLPLELTCDGCPPVSCRTDEHGAFAISSAPRREGVLRISEPSWTCRPQRIVPPQEGIELVVYRTAWLRGRLETHYEGTSHWAHVTLTTNQGWKHRMRPQDPFAIPCCPGEVVVQERENELGRFSIEEGEGRENVVFAVDLTPRSEADRPQPTTPVPYVDLDLTPIQGREAFFVASFVDLGLIRLGYHDGLEPVRIPLRSGLLRWVGVRCDRAAWRQSVAVGDRVLVERPHVAPLRVRLVDRRGHPIERGWVCVRWPGTRESATCLVRYRVPAGSAPGTFGGGEVGEGTWDLAWQEGRYAEEVLLRCGVEVSDPPTAVDLGVVVVPEPRALRVLVTTGAGVPVPHAVVRLRGEDRAAAVRAGPDGEAVLRILDPTDLVVEAEDGEGHRGTVRLADGVGSVRVVIREVD